MSTEAEPAASPFRYWLPRILSALVGVGLLVLWFRRYGHLLEAPEAPQPALLVLACLALPVGMAIQILRTGLLFGLGPRETFARLARPLLAAHGFNTLLPSMSGDLFEIAAVSRILGRSMREILAVLCLRSSMTISAVALMAALALITVVPWLGLLCSVALLLLPFAVNASWRLWTRLLRIPGVSERGPVPGGPYSLRATAGHHLLTIAMAAMITAGLWLMGLGLGQQASWPAVAGIFSAADLTSYLPLPMAGLGASQWGAGEAAAWLEAGEPIPALLVTANHAWQVLMGGATLLLAAWMGRRS